MAQPRSHPADHSAANGLRRTRLAFALLVLCGFVAVFADFRELVPVRAGHWLASVQVVPALLALAGGALVPGLILAALLLLTLAVGRVYCSVLCPLGLLQDLAGRLARWFRLRRKPLPFSKEHTLLRHLFVWSGVAAALAGWGAFALTLLDPYSHFGRGVSLLARPALTWLNNKLVWLGEAAGWGALYRVDLPLPALGAVLFTAALLTLILGLAALRGRLWCNTACPVGTVLGWISRHAAFRLAIDKEACTRCAHCLRSCKAQCIDLRTSQIDASRCVACYNCVSACDEHGIRHTFAWRRKAAPPSAQATVADPARRSLLRGSVKGLFLGTGLALALDKAKASSAEPHDEAEPIDYDELHRQKARREAGHGKGRRSAGVVPPGAKSVEHLLAHCTACQLCVSACPKHVLQPALFEYGLKGFLKPRLDFEASYCDFDCRACGEACPDGAIALLPLEEKQVAQIGIASFHEERCIVKVNGKDCAACSEHCPTKAVETVPFGDNLRLPRVNDHLCIGCGACQFACPVKPDKAITVAGLQEHGRARRPESRPAPPQVDKPAPGTANGGDFPF